MLTTTQTQAIADQTATEDSIFTFTVPENTFTDVDAGDILTYSATLENGTVLPSWLSFNATNRTFSGTPTNSEVGTLNIKVIATDKAGVTATDSFTITVANTNDAPILGSAIANQIATEDTAFSFIIPENTFADADAGDILTYSATPENGDALPSWLSFDVATRTFSGTPNNSEVGSLNIKVTATDKAGVTATDSFTITVANTNDAPILGSAIANQIATEDTAFSFTIPENTFADIDVSDILTYSATLETGSKLPTWLNFNAATRTFSGTPTDTASGSYNITVTATDTAAASVSDTFTLKVLNLINGTSNSETLLGTDDDDIVNAGAGNDTINGGAGNDTIDGGTGSDRALGGTGDDTYIVDSSRDVVVEAAGEGRDTVKSSASYTLTTNVEDLVLTSTANISGTGNELDNLIIGNLGNNLLKGLGGKDTLIGDAGDDTLVGGAGDDLLTGGEGADSFLFGSGAAFTLSAFGVDTITDFSKGGDKIVLSKASFTALSSAVNTNLLASEFATIKAGIVDEVSIAGSSTAKIVYNSSTGNLLYNPNGASAGLGSGGVFANLIGTTLSNLDANDLFVQS